MTSDFMFPTGGWLRDLSPKAREEIARRVPGVPVEAVAHEAAYYVLMRDGEKSAPTPAGARAKLHRLQIRCRKLHDDLQNSELAPLTGFVEQAAALQGETHYRLMSDLRENLLRAEAALAKARTWIPAGHRRTPRDRLVWNLKAILETVGQVADARPKGPLCQIVNVILEDADEEPSSVTSIVTEALKKTASR